MIIQFKKKKMMMNLKAANPSLEKKDYDSQCYDYEIISFLIPFMGLAQIQLIKPAKNKGVKLIVEK
jgi:hypothetical protein